METVVTLGEIVDSGHDLIANCVRCGHGKAVDLADLVARFGRGATMDAVATKLRCQACGSRNVSMTRAPVRW